MDQVAASPSQDRSQFRRLFYNKEVRSVFFQIVTVLGVCALIAYIGMNMLTNLEAVGKNIHSRLVCVVVVVFTISDVGNQCISITRVVKWTSSRVLNNPIARTRAG